MKKLPVAATKDWSVLRIIAVNAEEGIIEKCSKDAEVSARSA